MGVHGLWELLAPVGRRVSVETLTGKKLAIDASIWMIQFMKAMRDEKGEMVRNAHILGFFRRICKLLFLRTKPVFVFDGGTPTLKRRTVVARRRLRENAQAKMRKTAEKLLLNHLKAMRLKELAGDERQKNDIKEKKVITEEPNLKQSTDIDRGYNQEELDEMLAASLAADETGEASISCAGISDDKVYEDEDDDTEGEEEMILPELHGKVDPAVLASLPPSMQLDLLVQMRERLMAENRQKYQKVKKVPTRFSELQIQSYLKTVAFRREIDGVQKAAAGRGIGGVQTSRIASEANREFIFSSSFTGDKQTLISAESKKINCDLNANPTANSSNETAEEAGIIFRSDTLKGLISDQTDGDQNAKVSHDEVNTYLDERGHFRVSRVRALGIRMTRDLQRNLDMMKEIEQEKENANQSKLNEVASSKILDDNFSSTCEKIQFYEVEDKFDKENNNDVNTTRDPFMKTGTMEISFDYAGDDNRHDDDNIFSNLVAGHPVVDLNSEYSHSLKLSSHSDSDCEWEEGIIENKSHVSVNESKGETIHLQRRGGLSDETDVEWEEGFQGTQGNTSFFPYESHRSVTKGSLVEEEELQEAIRRSLDDMVDHNNMKKPFEDLDSVRAESIVSGVNICTSVHEVQDGPKDPVMHAFQPQLAGVSIANTDSLEDRFSPCLPSSTHKIHLDHKLLDIEEDKVGYLSVKRPSASDSLFDNDNLRRNEERTMDICSMSGDVLNSEFAPENSMERMLAMEINDSHHGEFLVGIDQELCETEKPASISAFGSMTDLDGVKELTENISVELSLEEDELSRPSFMKVIEDHDDKEDDLERELSFLHKERDELGIEQKKLERDAESLSSEMFSECQELLQMFGLPYIIAPMEAEAQCAYMDMLNLVDGVVTDDSDAFLFGALSVYKNIFDDRKYVETYLMKDIEHELGLNRDKLISMALLLGSDYTEGVSGIGIVNAIEVVNAFPDKNGLHEFREWIESPDPAILGNFDVHLGGKTKGKGLNETSSVSSSQTQESCDRKDHEKQNFMDKHRNVSKNWHIPSTFPSDAVISAYASPQVDKSTELFSWGKPDLFLLRKLCWEKFGWGNSKSDDLLLPVLKEYNKHETQLRLEAFYTFNERFAKIRSKRIRKAVKGITGNISSELVTEEASKQARAGKKRKARPSEVNTEKSGIESRETEHGVSSNEIKRTKDTDVELSERKNSKEMGSLQDESNLKQSTSIDLSLSSRKKSHDRGKLKERSRGKQTGRGRRKRNSPIDDAETSSDDDSDVGCSKIEKELQYGKMEDSPPVRRSGRRRKTASYLIPDEFDNCQKESETEKDLWVEQSAIGNETVAKENQDLGENITINTGICGEEGDFRNSQEQYLQFGGGFCLGEEDEEDTVIGGYPANVSGESNLENSNKLHSEATTGKTDASDTPTVNDDGDPKDSVSMTMNSMDAAVDDYGKRSVESLRAMPNLRRKRRKN